MVSTTSSLLRAHNALSDESVQNLLQEGAISSSAPSQLLSGSPLLRSQICELYEGFDSQSAGTAHALGDHLIDKLINFSIYHVSASPRKRYATEFDG